MHWCRRDGTSSDANYPIVTIRSTPPPPLSQGCPRAPLTAGFVAQYARVRWLDSALRRLYSTWKVCDRNHTLPCSYRDFDCDRLWPKYSIVDYVSMIDPTLLHFIILFTLTILAVYCNLTREDIVFCKSYLLTSVNLCQDLKILCIIWCSWHQVEQVLAANMLS